MSGSTSQRYPAELREWVNRSHRVISCGDPHAHRVKIRAWLRNRLDAGDDAHDALVATSEVPGAGG